MARLTCILTCCLLGALLIVLPAASYPSPSNYYRDEGQYEPEEIVDMLTRLNELMRMERKIENYKSEIPSFRDEAPSYKDDITSAKRALDMGLSRGYSGAIHAKHLMGVAAANYAGGPGRRRRDAH